MINATISQDEKVQFSLKFINHQSMRCVCVECVIEVRGEQTYTENLTNSALETLTDRNTRLQEHCRNEFCCYCYCLIRPENGGALIFTLASFHGNKGSLSHH